MCLLILHLYHEFVYFHHTGSTAPAHSTTITVTSSYEFSHGFNLLLACSNE